MKGGNKTKGDEWVTLGVACPEWAPTPEETTPYLSKIGGEPLWLHPISGRVPKCRLCRRKLFLVAQLCVPVDGIDRILYILACNASPCQLHRGAWLVLRSTVPPVTEEKKDDAGPSGSTFAVDDDWGDDEGDTDGFGGGGFGAMASESDEKKGEGAGVAEVRNQVWEEDGCTGEGGGVFPMTPLDIFYEPEDCAPGTSAPPSAVAAAEPTTSGEKEGFADEGYEKTGSTAQRAFLKFTKRIARVPRQVVRWSHKGTPLSIAGEKFPPPPPCENCGAPRVFEAQLLSTALAFLNPHDFPGAEIPPPNATPLSVGGLSFGVATIFSCSASCYPGEDYVEEYIRVDDEPDFDPTN
eukprot:Sspe_Gene.40075::Locus_19317_Transcript_1_1_Confidence_1.000_Length_1147::g.40075::m.40075/K14801/TSR4; pre-rRNA-processing protein TSR4